MPRSKICLIDANVWLALAVDSHEHHAEARDWFFSLPEESAALCRVTQMALLRLLTSRAVMGEDVLTPLAAWEQYRQLRRDWRVTFASEPAGIEETWIGLMGERASCSSWTDSYLAAFALGHSCALATFDRGFSRWKNLNLKVLPTSR